MALPTPVNDRRDGPSEQPMSNDAILVTGGAGFIGTHVLVELVQAGYQPVVLDDFSNSRPEALHRVARIVGRPIPHVAGDIRSPSVLDAVFASQRDQGTPIRCVVHLAGCKAVGESVRDPLKYYDVNVGGTLTLLQVMRRFGAGRLVFSSSATVYGKPRTLPITEHHALQATSPYGRSKLTIEGIIADLCASDPRFGAIALRYFNPIGAHPSGLIGECPTAEPNNLFPYMTQVAIGARPRLTVFGSDYRTVDGTGVRDYLHVVDLARGHVRAVDRALRLPPGMLALNLGTGQGTSVLQLIECFTQATGIQIPYTVAARRPGDIDAMWADPTLAERELGWRARHGLSDMCAHGWHWQRSNPEGYPATAPDGARMPAPPAREPLPEMVA
jgi:UDP-glucose 4-epimerase